MRPKEPPAGVESVIFGAGNIGRGFLGPLCQQGGLNICFVDVVRDVVDLLNQRGRYPLEIVDNDRTTRSEISSVTALDGRDTNAVADRVARAELVWTAVGARALPAIANPLAEGIRRRAQSSKRPLNIIICENLHQADTILHDLLAELLIGPDREFLDQQVGLIMSVVARMVPVMTEEVLREDRLKIRVEPYALLPVDAEAIRGNLLPIPALIPCCPFEAFVQRKLYVHNGLHAIAAYLGYQAGHEFSYQAVEDPVIRPKLLYAGRQIAHALHCEHEFDMVHLSEHVAELLRRFGNRALGDQVIRLARDPIRKLGPQDRLIGAARLILRHGGDASVHAEAIKAALQFDLPDDPSSVKLQAMLKTRSLLDVLSEISALPPDDPLAELLQDAGLKTSGN